MSKHTTLFPGYSDLQGDQLLQKFQSNSLEQQTQSSAPGGLSKIRKRKLENSVNIRPKRLPLKVNPAVGSDTDLSVLTQSSPWQAYHKICEDDEGGRASIAHKNLPDHDMVAIKSRQEKPNWILNRLVRVDHRNVVALIEAFRFEGQIFLVYEAIGLSLRDLVRCPYGPLKEYEIATVCKGVLNGILFIEERLRCVCPPLDTNNILIVDSGDVKIANVGDVLMLPQADGQYNGTEQLGSILLELLEPGTWNVDTSRRVLSNTSLWGKGIQDFLDACARQSAQELSKHIFLDMSPGIGCLKPYIDVFRRAGRTQTSKTSTTL